MRELGSLRLGSCREYCAISLVALVPLGSSMKQMNEKSRWSDKISDIVMVLFTSR